MGLEEVAESLRLSVVPEKEGCKAAAGSVSGVAMEVSEVAKEVVVLTSLGTRNNTSARLEALTEQMVQANSERLSGGENLVEGVMQSDAEWPSGKGIGGERFDYRGEGSS